MKNTLFLLAFFVSLAVNSQNYEVTYNMKQVAKNIDLTTNIKTYLSGNGEKSLYVEDFRNSYQENNSSNDIINLPTENNPTYFKDLKNKIVIYNDHIRFNFFNIIDSIGTLDWKIEAEKKEILGYSCQKATLNFRGRSFIVYFSQKISTSDGPLKFSGLPGLILEVFSDDSVASFHYLAESIKFPKDKIEIKNVYEGKKTITYSEYLQKYEEKYKESLTRIINEQGETRPMSRGFMEVLINN
jgi:GLPGLI family protein